MILRLSRISLALILCFMVASCTKDGSTCGVSDQVVFLKEFKINDVAHYLYERRAGFSDKVSFLEYYSSRPKFDQCGEPSIEQISQIPISDAVGTPTAIIIENMIMDIEYDKGNSYSTPDLTNLPITAK